MSISMQPVISLLVGSSQVSLISPYLPNIDFNEKIILLFRGIFKNPLIVKKKKKDPVFKQYKPNKNHCSHSLLLAVTFLKS